MQSDNLDEILDSQPQGHVEFDLGSTTQRFHRDLLRFTISADAVLAANQVIDLIGGRAAIVRAWLRDHVPSLPHPSGRTIYRWGDVIDAMRRAA